MFLKIIVPWNCNAQFNIKLQTKKYNEENNIMTNKQENELNINKRIGFKITLLKKISFCEIFWWKVWKMTQLASLGGIDQKNLGKPHWTKLVKEDKNHDQMLL